MAQPAEKEKQEAKPGCQAFHGRLFTAWNEIICHWKIPLLMQSQCEINSKTECDGAHEGAYLPEAACKSLDQKQN